MIHVPPEVAVVGIILCLLYGNSYHRRKQAEREYTQFIAKFRADNSRTN